MEDGGLSVAQNFFSGIGLISGAGNRGIGRVNQAPQQSFVANDFDVVLNARPVGDAIQQARHVTHVANRLKILVAIKLLDQRDHVDGTRGFRQIDHASVNPAVRVERKVFDSQVFGGLVISKVVEQDRAQNRALGFYVRRKRADVVVSSGHGLDVFPSSQNANGTLTGHGL